MREFSFGKNSTPPEEDADPDSGSSPLLNVFYAKNDLHPIKHRPDFSKIKEEPFTPLEDNTKFEYTTPLP